ncbi:MAG TPA: hypothetical protein VII98_03420 [Solirubrobacteraceae bacterium]
MPDERLEAHEDIGARIRELSGQVSAPPQLRAAVARERLAGAPGARRRRTARRPLLAAAAGLAAVVAVTVALLGGSGAEAPSAAQAAALALRPATQPPPPVDARNARFVARSVGTVRFPNYGYEASWPAVGSRSDVLAGHGATTVVYGRGPARVGYTVVDGSPLRTPVSAPRASFRQIHARVIRRDGGLAVVWQQGGHTCIVASRDAGLAQLLRFAAWRV